MAVFFTIRLRNEPGSLGALAGKLAEYGIDIRSLAAGAVGSYGCVVVSVSNDEAAREVLRQARYQFVEGEAINVGVVDRPGALAQLAGRLGEAGVNIQAIVVLGRHQGKAELAITVENPQAAQRVLAAAHASA